MTKTNITNEIALYIKDNTTCKFNVSGLTLESCDVIKDESRPSKRKVIRTPDTVKMSVFYGSDVDEELGNYIIRRYTSSIFVQADTEDNLQLALDELRSVFYCWESNGGGVFQTGGTPFHRVIAFEEDSRGRESASIMFTVQSRIEAKST